jgi:hypothetical protein
MIRNERRGGTGGGRGRRGVAPWLRVLLFFCFSFCGWLGVDGKKGWRLENVSKKKKRFFGDFLYCEMRCSTYLGGGEWAPTVRRA